MTAAPELESGDQDEAWHLRSLTLWRLSMTPAERLKVNSRAYKLWLFGQQNKARVIATRKAAERDRPD